MSNDTMPTPTPATPTPANSTPATPTSQMGRRGLFRLGGLTLATAAVAAACGKSEAGDVPARVGEGGTTPKLPDAVVDDGVLLRTMAGIETSIAAAYGKMLDDGLISGGSATLPDLGDQTAQVANFQMHHTMAAESFNVLAQEQGAEPWTCGNTRLDNAFIAPIFDRVVNGAAATDSAKAVPPSEDPVRDMINLVHTLESLSAASCQALVASVNDIALRFSAMQIGVRSSRQAALVALRINPGGYVTAVSANNAQPGVTTTSGATETTQNIAATTAAPTDSDAPPPTEIPLPTAIPSQFGPLSAITYIGGAGDENGV
ncbi:MAG: hypothetical protein Q7V88_17445, partial [Actinomycetota bacterium]|nr:hypothetical protein [Actinomycetota bacterium]